VNGGERDDYQAEVRRLRNELAQLRGEGLREVPPPRRLTKDEILRAHLERMVAAAGGEHSTIKLSRNAKGDTQIEVSVRTGDSEEVATVDDAAAKAKAVYDTLAAFYPIGTPDAGDK